MSSVQDQALVQGEATDVENELGDDEPKATDEKVVNDGDAASVSDTGKGIEDTAENDAEAKLNLLMNKPAKEVVSEYARLACLTSPVPVKGDHFIVWTLIQTEKDKVWHLTWTDVKADAIDMLGHDGVFKLDASWNGQNRLCFIDADGKSQKKLPRSDRCLTRHLLIR